MHIGFIGLGLLGLPMATNLLDAGHALKVYNRTASKADPLVARGAKLANEAIEVAGEIVVTSLWDGPVVEELITPAFLDRMKGGLHISTTTMAPEVSKRLAKRHAEHGVAFVEAPVFGRPEAAAAKQLNIPYAGAAAHKARAKPILTALGASGLFDLGEQLGAALATKLAGNFMMFAATRTFAEALQMATHAGADPKLVADMLTSTLFASPIYKGYGQRLVEQHAKTGVFGTGFVSKIPEKDLGLFVESAGDVPPPIANLFRELI
ncbi:MAG: NAD(P)-dependent oxidoreductase [Kofleriaceae bacterium]